MSRMAIVFTHCSPTFQCGELWRDARCTPSKFFAKGSAAYVAHDPGHLDAYEPWFPGLKVRAASRLRHCPLHPSSAMYLPVSFNSWVVVASGADGLGAAFEAATLLGVETFVCPAFDDLDAVRRGLAREYERWHDHVRPKT
jgi:hypothetical protein